MRLFGTLFRDCNLSRSLIDESETQHKTLRKFLKNTDQKFLFDKARLNLRATKTWRTSLKWRIQMKTLAQFWLQIKRGTISYGTETNCTSSAYK